MRQGGEAPLALPAERERKILPVQETRPSRVCHLRRRRKSRSIAEFEKEECLGRGNWAQVPCPLHCPRVSQWEREALSRPQVEIQERLISQKKE
jgi:hypothetical protein